MIARPSADPLLPDALLLEVAGGDSVSPASGASKRRCIDLRRARWTIWPRSSPLRYPIVCMLPHRTTWRETMSSPVRQAPERSQSQVQHDREELRELDAELGLAAIPIELRARLSSAFKAMDAMLLAEWYALKGGQAPVVEVALQLWRTERRRIARRAPEVDTPPAKG